MPSGVRNTVADALGIAREQARVVVGDVGGGFGMKTGAYLEDVALAHAAHQLRRSVKWVADRSEEFLSTYHGRDVQTHAELALDAGGRILALRIASQANVGAYATGTGVAIQLLIGPWVQTSVYDIQTIDFRFQAVLQPGAYRRVPRCRPARSHLQHRAPHGRGGAPDRHRPHRAAPGQLHPPRADAVQEPEGSDLRHGRLRAADEPGIGPGRLDRL
jgi:hypothetical protein